MSDTRREPLQQTLLRHLDDQVRAFSAYLRLIEEQQQMIVAGDLGRLQRSMGRERDAVQGLEARGRVIAAMWEILPAVVHPEYDRVYREVCRRHRELRESLAHRRDETAARMGTSRLPRRPRSVYRQQDTGSMINLTT